MFYIMYYIYLLTACTPADRAYKKAVASRHRPQTVFRHGETRVSLGPAAIHTLADGSGIKWTTPPAPEVQAAHEAAGSIETGFGGGDTMYVHTCMCVGMCVHVRMYA